MTRLIVTRDAETDRDVILDYLEREASVQTAAAYAERFAESIERLIDFPGSGAPRPALGAETRIAIVYPYLLIYDYSIASGTIILLRILHGRRNITCRLILR